MRKASLEANRGGRSGYTGILSSASRVELPLGENFEAGRVRGYHIDFRLKPDEHGWPPRHVVAAGEPVLDHYTAQWVAQWGLGCFEQYLAGEGESRLALALAVADSLVEAQAVGGAADGAWFNGRSIGHTFKLRPPWVSAMAQGEGASLLVRAFLETGAERYADAAVRAVGPLRLSPRQGGVRRPLGDGFFLEEYPTDPGSFVLNGGIFALWGLFDIATGLGDEDARAMFEEGAGTLGSEIWRWDTGSWSRYDLYPFPIRNYASSAYHELHINQLLGMERICDLADLNIARRRFQSYATRLPNRVDAFVRKVGFRLLLPRNRLLKGRMPFGAPATD